MQKEMENFLKSSLVLLIFFSIQIFWIQKYFVNVPYWDQWDSEASVYIMLETNQIDWSELWRPHNEHRVLFTRLFNGTIFLLRGGWDPYTVAICQSFLFSIFVGLLVYSVHCNFKPENKFNFLYIALLAIPLFSGIQQGENILSGFNNQFYFGIIFGVLIFEIEANTYSKEKGFSLIQSLLLILSLFTVASGILIPIIIIIFRAFILFLKPSKENIINFLFVLIVCILGFSLLHEVEEHRNLKAKDFGQFIHAIFSFLFLHSSAFGILICTGISVFSVKKYKSFAKSLNLRSFIELEIRNLDNFYFLWILLQLFALAYGRASGIDASRYMILHSLIAFFASWQILEWILLNKEKKFKFIVVFFCFVLIFSFKLSNRFLPYVKARKDLLLAHKEFLLKNENLDSSFFGYTPFSMHPNRDRVMFVISKLGKKNLWMQKDN